MKKKALFIGGTGTISTAITARLANDAGWELTLLNRGSHSNEVPAGVRQIRADIADEADVARKLEGLQWDCVCDFIGFTPDQVERDWRLFRGRTAQYMYISSASAYQKPPQSPFITEQTPLENPFWEYSRNKIACEEFLFGKWREEGFPVTVIRPSHTYGDRSVPVGVHGDKGSWQVLKRMLEGKTVPVAADGETLWTMTTSEDFAVYFCGLCGNSQAIGEAYHITSDESIPWNEAYRIIAEHLGVEFKPCYVPAHLLARVRQYDYNGALLGDKTNSVIFDNSKVMCATGIPPIHFTPYREGAKRSIDYILSHPELQKEDPAFDAFCDRVEAAMNAAAELLLEEK